MRNKLLLSSLLLGFSGLVKADLFLPLMSADTYGRAGAGIASVSSAAATIENPAGLNLNYLPKNSPHQAEGLFDLAIAANDAIQMGKEDDDDIFTKDLKADFSGGFNFANERYGIALASGYFGSSLRYVDDESVYDGINNEITTQYYALGTGINMLPLDWPINLNLGASLVYMPKAGFANVFGVQTKILDTTNFSLSLGASTRSFTHDDKAELADKYYNFKKAAMDLPEQTALGVSWLIKGLTSSYRLDLDYKKTDYSNTLHMQDLPIDKNYGGIWNSSETIQSWHPAMRYLDEYTSTHLAVSKMNKGSTLTLGIAAGNSTTANLDSLTLGLMGQFDIEDGAMMGLGVQAQSIEIDGQKDYLFRFILSLGGNVIY